MSIELAEYKVECLACGQVQGMVFDEENNPILGQRCQNCKVFFKELGGVRRRSSERCVVYCDVFGCEADATEVVKVSIDLETVEVRFLCGACEEVYTWGLQHGRFESARRVLQS